MEVLSQRPMFSSDPSTKGFDLSAGKKWIYPENYPLRDYQFNIVKSALYHNTLVCLPTGLGKTFIAAVVMYNFWRWYPQGIIVFLAPTKPLVAQQIHACHDIMGIPSNETIELTGTTDQKKRQVAWTKRRVIFATPQVFHKDLEKNIVPTELVKCVVIDEAHKALGKHSYCESIRLLSEKNKYFRIVGLSATPGGKLDAVQNVVKNLHITHLELRDETSPDITPYINERKLDIILVGLGSDLEKFKDRYITIMDRHVRVLVDNNILRGFTSNITKGRIFHLQKEWLQKPNKGYNHGHISKTLNILMTMYHAYDVMVHHGLRTFYNFYQKHDDKFWLSDEQALMQLLEEINYFLGPFPDVNPLPDGSLPEIPNNVRFGHKKFEKLKDLLLRHFESFENKEENTRAIVFVEFRESVNEIYVLLLQSMPLLRPQKFVGQAGQKQKAQKQALEDFRCNKVNVLISTSVGEEGLDVGEVDLIVCFDVSQHSPIRLVQRMGRTGRKRDGHIIALVTDGKEHQTLKTAMARRDSLNNKVLHSSGIIAALHEESPRMVPDEFQPECMKMHLTSLPKTTESSKLKGKQKEPRKPRKRADPSSKAKNSKIPDSASQSSLMRFIKKTRDDTAMEIDTDIVCMAVNEIRPSTMQNSQQSVKRSNNCVKSSNIKLLTSDNAAVEFLTLCTMKKSEHEETNIERVKTNPYLPSYHEQHKNIDIFVNFKIPELQILDCLKNLTEYIAPIGENDDATMCDVNDRYWPTQRFDVSHDYHECPDNNVELLGSSKFEALLDDSSCDSDKSIIFEKKLKNEDFPITEKVDWGENVEGFGFEDLLDEWSDESIMIVEKNDKNEDTKENELANDRIETDVPLKIGTFEELLNDESRTSIEIDENCEKNETNAMNDEARNSAIKLGVFEDLLNDDSTTDPEEVEVIGKNSFDPKNNEIANSTIKLSVFEDLLDDDSKTSVANNEFNENHVIDLTNDEPANSPIKLGAFEDLLNDDSRSSHEDNAPNENDDSDATIDGLTKNSPIKSGAFDDVMNFSSDDDETQFDMEISRQKKSENLETPPKNSEKNIINNDSMEALIHSKEMSIPFKNFEINNRESVDLLENYDLGSSHLFSNDTAKRHFKVISDIRKMPENSAPTIENSNFPQISSKSCDSKQASPMKNTTDDHLMNIDAQGQIPSVPSDLQYDSWNSRFSTNTSSREILCLVKENIEERAESEDDIFGVDDLMVDSDFEEEINNIEKSAENVNTTEKQIFSKSIENRNTGEKQTLPENVEIDDSETLFIREKPKNIIDSTNSLTAEPAAKEKNVQDGSSKLIEDRKSSKSFRLEWNLNDCNWEKVVDVKCSSFKSAEPIIEDRESEDAKNTKSSPGTSFRLEINRQNCDWNTKVFKVRGSSENTSFVERSNCSLNKQVGVKNLTPAKAIVSDLILDDCDWGSDFETSSAPSKSTKCVEKIVNRESTKICQGSSKNDAKETTKLSKVENTTGWIKTQNSKSRLSLSKKLSLNFCKNSLTKETGKEPPSKPDSDSENEFAVSRIETTISKEIDSNFFVKPLPIVGKSSTMNKRVARNPLSLRRNDDNKIATGSLQIFSAPEKYTQRQGRAKISERSVGAGRQKSTSLDLETRKRKKRLSPCENGKRARVRSEFIDDEAEVSEDENLTSGSSGSDDDLDGFVSYTQNVDEPIDMQAHYLQTVKSPRRPGGFHIRRPKSPSPDLHIYSQPLLNETDSYIYDSFCVAEDDVVFDESATPDEDSELEELETRRKSRKRKRIKSTEASIKKKRKVLAPESDGTSSEDETEILRRQIHDESLFLRNRKE